VEIALQLFYVISWLFVLKILQLALWPYLKPYLAEYAYPVAYPLSVLLFTLISWYCGLVHFPVQVAAMPFVVLFIYSLWRRQYTKTELKASLYWDATFLVFFVFVLEMRFINPVLTHYSEAFMDHAFIASIMRTPVVPPLDPWVSGEPLTMYYYLGHWMLGMLGIITGVPSNVVWNLALPTVIGLASVMLLALGKLFIPKLKWVPLALIVLIDPAVIFFILRGDEFYSALNSSRWVINGVITEYPFYSLIIGDAHAHVLGLFNQITFIFLLGYLVLKWGEMKDKTRILLSFLCILSLGAMGLISTWDAMVYGPITIVAAFLVWYMNRKKKGELKKVALTFAFIVFFSLIIYLPYYLKLGGESVQTLITTKVPSDPIEFMLFSGFFLIIFYALSWKTIRDKPMWLLCAAPFLAMGQYSTAIALIPFIYIILRKVYRFQELLALSGLSVLIFCELFSFFQGSDLQYFRFITVFKFYYIAWVLLCSSSLMILSEMFCSRFPDFSLGKKARTRLTILIIVILLAVPPVFQFDVGKGLLGIDFKSGYYTLDGFAYLEKNHPDDLTAIKYLRKLPGREQLVEAVDGDYTYFSRISAFTGIPAILGQPSHEFQWRTDKTGWYWDRQNDVQSIYEDPSKSLPLLRKYNTTLLYLGDLEKSRYNVNLPKTGLTIIFKKGNVTIYRVNSVNDQTTNSV